jgi:hypothetical protein
VGDIRYPLHLWWACLAQSTVTRLKCSNSTRHDSRPALRPVSHGKGVVSSRRSANVEESKRRWAITEFFEMVLRNHRHGRFHSSLKSFLGLENR